ncbi:MAG: UDP-N-acetylmuramoyl-L-alanyl-D-glutamate--2,6-diaminopimelate ligase [Betaproteobacteria bacterium]|nr:MAG: UDP-N-acetylmuramoyl-L-alanyl-D-glutamate--2,6-diaminopimelate ligase [Betaproteobacteria bacterium]
MIVRLTADSRGCAPGDCFFAWPGERADGRRHIEQAIARAVAAVVWEREGFDWREQWRVPNAGVSGLKAQAGHLAHAFYGRPSESLWVCGITGTNGKTSCSQWLAALLARAGERAAVIGTLGNGFPGELAESAHTTPDALELHRLLAEFRRDGARAVAMEVSSHGLDQGRVNGVDFRCALFTNLSHDHLDYHGAMAAYAEAKAALFEARGLETAVLNLDDPFGLQLAQRMMARGVRTIGYGLAPAATHVDGRIVAREIRAAAQATRVVLASSWGDAEITLKVLGRFNVANALGVLGCLVAYGVPFASAAAMLEQLPEVPGRMQRIGGEGEPLLVVDYAHTPDAIEKVLLALRPVAQARGGRLWIVFGAGGDRDPTKRRPMGAAASRHADGVVLTSDNPRGEDPQAIIEAIRAGVAAPCSVESDRAAAIAQAVHAAAAADVVVLAGKGHEAYQEIAGQRLPFSDAACAHEALRRRGPR